MAADTTINSVAGVVSLTETPIGSDVTARTIVGTIAGMVDMSGSGGGSVRPTAGMIYPRGQG